MDDRALYLEADEDITSAIDKLRKAPEGPVQIVVPKRSTLLQSVINLKLLKKAADDSGRELVLVTGDKVATDLAGRVGLAVAASVGAKAVLPVAPAAAAAPAAEEVIEDETPAPEAPPVSPAAPAKPTDERPDAMRKAAPTAGRRKDAAPLAEAAAVATAAEESTDKPPKSPKLPNYSRFNKRVIWAGAIVGLIIVYFVAMFFLTSAKVTLFASASPANVSNDFAVDPSATSFDPSSNVLPGQTLSGSKSASTTFQATGTKDEGTKASGTMTISNCYDTSSHTFVAGTRFQAPDGKVFTSNSDVTVPGGQGSFAGCNKPGTASVGVTATQNGDDYNEGPAAYTIPGLPASEQSGGNAITAHGGQMSGGTSKTVKVVQQSDLDTAQKAALSQAAGDEQKDLKGKAKSGQYIITSSFSQAADNVTSSPAVGEEATSATLNLTVTYTMLAVNKSDLSQFIKGQALEQLGKDDQIYDDGLGSAQIASADKTKSGLAQFKLSTTAYGGTKIDTAALAKQLQGKRYGEAVDTASQVAGVQSAKVSLWPAWATSLPHIGSHVKVTVSVANPQS